MTIVALHGRFLRLVGKRSTSDMALSGRTAIFNICNKKLTMSPGFLAMTGSPPFRGVTRATTPRWKALGERKLFAIRPFQWLNGLAKLYLILCFFGRLSL